MLELPSSPDDVNLSAWSFWAAPAREREGAFEILRRERPVPYHAGTSEPGQGASPGYWAPTRHADVLDVSRNANDWSSEPTVSINHFDPRLEPFFRSMVSMDDPRRARLRKDPQHALQLHPGRGRRTRP